MKDIFDPRRYDIDYIRRLDAPYILNSVTFETLFYHRYGKFVRTRSGLFIVMPEVQRHDRILATPIQVEDRQYFVDERDICDAGKIVALAEIDPCIVITGVSDTLQLTITDRLRYETVEFLQNYIHTFPNALNTTVLLVPSDDEAYYSS